jgi:hypothetical protein
MSPRILSFSMKLPASQSSAPEVWKWPLGFWKICGPLMLNSFHKNVILICFICPCVLMLQVYCINCVHNLQILAKN